VTWQHTHTTHDTCHYRLWLLLAAQALASVSPLRDKCETASATEHVHLALVLALWVVVLELVSVVECLQLPAATTSSSLKGRASSARA
jgi:hypothetical protein